MSVFHVQVPTYHAHYNGLYLDVCGINRDTCAPFVMLNMYMPVVPGCTFVVTGKYVKLFIC